MRWTVIFVMAFAGVAFARQPSSRTPPPPGTDISARDGDRIIVEDEARIQIVRRRQATLRTIFSHEERRLIVLVDYPKPGEFPDGQVDWAYTFYQIEGTWPIEERWEALTTIFQYEATSRLTGLAFETPRGLVQLVPHGQLTSTPDPRAVAVLTHRGASGSPRRAISFAEAETLQLADAARSKASNSTFSTVMLPPDSGQTGTGTASASVTLGARVSGGMGEPNSTRQTIGDPMPPATPSPQQSTTPPPSGQEIAANDGDRVVVDDEARVQIVRRRQATIRTIFRQEQQLLILLADYAKAGELPDGQVDSTFTFYDLEGDWPFAGRWEALTTIFQYEGDPKYPAGYAVATPQGLVHLSPGRPGLRKPDPAAITTLWFRGSTIGVRRGLSFAEAERLQLAEAAKRRRAPTSSSGVPASPR